MVARAEVTDLEHHLNVIEKTLDQLRQTGKTTEENQVLLDECSSWWKRAKGMIHPKKWRWWIKYAELDQAWSCVQEIRHSFCTLLPLSELGRVALEVSADLDYVTDSDTGHAMVGEHGVKRKARLLGLRALVLKGLVRSGNTGIQDGRHRPFPCVRRGSVP